MKRFLYFLHLLTVISLPHLLAQEPATITIRKTDLIAISLSPIIGPEGQLITNTLTNDLTIVGLFSFQQSPQGSFLISGVSEPGRLKALVRDSQGNTILSKTYSGSPRSLAHQFADDIVETLTGQPGIANTKIAFVSDRSGTKEIYLADYDGANVRQLTNDRSINVAPALSKGAQFLAYTGYKSGYADIYLVDLTSGQRRRVVSFPGTNSGAAFSPDSTRLACTVSRDGNPEIYIVSLTGSGARRLTRTPGVESSPSWAPSANEIVFSSDDRGSPLLFRISTAGGIPSPIPTGFSYNTEPDWSPDGKKIAFVARSGSFNIAVKNLQSGETQIVATSATNPSWGPNSRHLLATTADGSTLFLLDTQTGRRFPIVTALGKISEPSWSR
ncbi:MAG: hypothetical protein N2035_08070 [Chthoniobacterales bacterium]|nr:hypothetical protein [Chthoniobacterales bacterium]